MDEDGPYRSAPDESSGTEGRRDDGIVGDVIGQFADPFAFYRELVQNSLDAGSETVEVRITYDDAAQAMRVVVRDRGEGMDRDILENQLLVLFRSTKEKDPTKIGKFGIGFASVLSPNPRVVVIDTARGGKRFTLHLYPDLSYQLFDTGNATSNGTTVELELPMQSSGVLEFAERSHQALRRWCRHASRPIQCIINVPGVAIDERIDCPLMIEGAVVEVRRETAEGGLAVVALSMNGAPYGGFFNHGLTLYETTEPLLGRLSFKVQDARLGHTLSRDNVRRDGNFERALALVRELSTDELPAAISRELAAAAEHDFARYAKIVHALARSEVALPRDAWAFRLIDPVDGHASMPASELMRCRPLLGSRGGSRLTDLFGKAKTPIVQLSVGSKDADPWFVAQITAACRAVPTNVNESYTVVLPIEPSGSDLVLIDELAATFDAVVRTPSKIVLAKLVGCDATRLALGAESPDDGDGLWLVHRERGHRSPFGRLLRSALVINASHPHVQAARKLAATNHTAAVTLLARAILLAYEMLDIDRSQRLFERAVR